MYENGGITPLILNLRTRWRRLLNLTLRPLYPRERTWVTGGCVGLEDDLDSLEKTEVLISVFGPGVILDLRFFWGLPAA